MLVHSRMPVLVTSVSPDHPMYRWDLRAKSDEYFAECAARAMVPSFEVSPRFLSNPMFPDAQLATLVSTALRRFTRVILQRARIMKSDSAENLSLDTQDQLLESAVLAFVHMVGALEAVAVINGRLAGIEDSSRMGWQKESFRRSLREKASGAPSISKVYATSATYYKAVLEFRNTIHQTMPQTLIQSKYHTDPAFSHVRIELDGVIHKRAVEAFQSAGWLELPKVGRDAGRNLLLRPESLVSKMLLQGYPVLDSLLEATCTDWGLPRHVRRDPAKTLYPQEAREYALKYFRLGSVLSRDPKKHSLPIGIWL